MGIFLIISLTSCKKKPAYKLDENVPYNLLIITIDTLRADRLGCYGYKKAETPNIDRLAQKGVRFENCYSSIPLTLPSHCSIFTGREPITHNVRNNGSYFLDNREETFPELLKSHNYTTSAIVSSFILHSKFGLNQGFDYYDDSLDIKKMAGNPDVEITADVVYKKFRHWLDMNYHQKFFSWIHFYDPHSPYQPPGEYAKRFKNTPYNGEISYVDFHIGKIIEDLQAMKILDKTLIIITSDHGEAFGEHKEIGHGIFCYEETLRVPLIFYNPPAFKKGRVVSQRTRLIDIMPTILDLLRIEIPPDIKGHSFAQLLFEDVEVSEPAVYFESLFGKEEMNWAPLTGIISANYKYISLPEPELYDLNNDPMEKTNLYKKKNRLAKDMDQKLKKFMISNSGFKQSSKRDLSKDDIKKLESLGYISKDSQKSKIILDPKDGIQLINKLNNISYLIRSGKYEEANTSLKKISVDHRVIKNPKFYDISLELYRKKDEVTRIEAILKQAIEVFPEMERFKVNLALFYFRNRKLDKSEQLCENVIESNPKNTAAYILLGKIYKQKKKLNDAISYYKKARKIEPSNLMLQLEYGEMQFEMGHIGESREIINSIMANDALINKNDNPKIMSKIGFLLLQLNEYDRVITMCLQLLSNGEKSPDILNQLGMAYFKKGEFQNASDAYQKAFEHDKKNPLTLSNMGTLNLTLFRLKKDEKFLSQAVEFYARAVESNPETVTALNGLAVAYSFAGEREKAISYWKKALSLDPEHTNIYFNLGITYLETGNKKKALEYLNKCKEKFYSKLNSREQHQLDILIKEAKQ
jgi:arylsulfatase A-like enzyme/Tfp pilus assembly protein PilF